MRVFKKAILKHAVFYEVSSFVRNHESELFFLKILLILLALTFSSLSDLLKKIQTKSDCSKKKRLI